MGAGQRPALFFTVNLMRQQRALAEKIENMIQAALADLGYEIFHIEMNQDQGRTLLIMIERANGEGVVIQDCVTASRAISEILGEDGVEGHYTLEVSSPGIDRPLIRRKDFERYCGEVIQVSVARLIEGQKKFAGPLTRVGDDGIVVEVRGTHITIPFEDILKAKLSLKEQLAPKGQKKGRKER